MRKAELPSRSLMRRRIPPTNGVEDEVFPNSA